MTKTYKVWNNGQWTTATEGQEVFVGRTSSARSVFGEKAVLKRATKTQLVFETVSGQIVKTGIEDLEVKGKLGKQRWFVSLNKFEEGSYINTKVVAY